MLAVLAGAAQLAQAEPQRLASSCEASAARFVACPRVRTAAACLLVADNEESKRLFLYSMDAAGQLSGATDVEIVSADAAAPKLDDLEAIESDGERIWLVASHGRKRWRDEAAPEKRCGVDKDRLAIFTGTWSPAADGKTLPGTMLATKKKEWKKLLRAKCATELFQLDARDAAGHALVATACAAFAANDENARRERSACEAAFNIEGAALIPGEDGKRLWLGLRAPTLDGNALLLRLAQADALRFDGIATLDLGEARGVRDMAYRDGRLWLLAGPVADSSGVAFALEAVAIDSLDSGAQLAAHRVGAVPPQAEGLALFAGARRAGIVTDGEAGDAPGAPCNVPSTFLSIPLE
jgi:hypothetical protein